MHVDAFLASLHSRNYAEKSINSFRLALDAFLLFLAAQEIRRLQDVTLSHLEAYRSYLVEERALAPNSVHQYLRVVRKFFAYLEETSVVFMNVAIALELPRFQRSLGHVPSEEEIGLLLATPDTSVPTGLRDRAMMEIAYSTGIRVGELCSLRLHDLQLREHLLRIMGKGRKERLVPLGKTATKWLRRYLAESRSSLQLNKKEDALWLSSRQGKPLQILSVEQSLRRYSRQAGLSPTIAPHALRRACATHMLRNGAHPVEVQLLLGHASLKTLSQYLGLTITDLKVAHRNSNPGQ